MNPGRVNKNNDGGNKIFVTSLIVFNFKYLYNCMDNIHKLNYSNVIMYICIYYIIIKL